MAETTTLKSGAKRTVVLVRGSDGARVAKRFHDPGWFGYARDWWRARGEQRVLETLHERGVAVPRAFGLRRAGGAWQVEMEAVEGAQSLDALLDDRARSPAPFERLARELGVLVARLHAAGVDHPDLHAGNVLVGGDGRLWLVDFHHARLRRLAPATLLDRLVSLLGQARERLTPRERARMALAWQRALPQELRAALPDPRVAGAELEDAARARRRDEVRRESRRWLRETSRGRLVDEGGLRFLEPQPLAPEQRSGLVTWLRESVTLVRPGVPIVRDDRFGRALLVTAPDREGLEAEWRELGRLVLHGVSCARPLLLGRGEDPWAVYGLPAGSARLEGRALGEEPVGSLLAIARDRGLAAREPLVVYGDGHAAAFGPGTRLVDV